MIAVAKGIALLLLAIAAVIGVVALAAFVAILVPEARPHVRRLATALRVPVLRGLRS